MKPTVESRKLYAALATARGRALTWIMIGGGTAAAAAAVSCDQPKPFCIVTPAPFAVRLDVESQDGDCDDFGPASFNAAPEVGFAPYYQKDEKGQPDYRRGAVAIRTAEVAGLVTTAEGFEVENSSGGKIYSMGDFATDQPDAEGICSVPTLSETRLVLDEVPAVEDDPATEDEDESFAGQAAQDIKLVWSDVKIVVTAALFGTQIEAKVTDTRVGPEGQTCTFTYRALGLSPAHTCYKTDEDGAPIMKDDGTYDIDPAQCDPEANPEEGRFTGSGISPLSNQECDAVTGYCLLVGDTFPAYKD
jgi:hypothetical protein